METKYKITIPKPCHEDWNAMTPDETGRFCDVCTKGVVDFTEMKAPEIQAYFLKNQGQSVCGRFRNEQINDKFDFQIPQSVLQQQLSFHKAFLLTLFVVMGSTLFSCKNHDDATLGKVTVVKDTAEIGTTKGVILPPKGSLPQTDTVKNHYTTGDVSLPYDSIEKAKSKKEGKVPYNKNEVDLQPSYPGGLTKFYEYFVSNFKILEADKQEKKMMFATFIVEKDGSLSTIKVLRGFNERLNNEAIKVLEASPKWSAGEMNGEKVRVLFTLPIRITP